MIYISKNMHLTIAQRPDPNKPRLCWESLATIENVTTDAEDYSGLENMVNSSTAVYAKFNTLDEFCIEIDTDGAALDYVGIAKHNLTSGAEIKLVAVVDDLEFDLTEWETVGTSQVFLKLIREATPDSLKICIRSQSEFVRIAVLYVGLSTAIQRNIYVGHTPITLGGKSSRITGVSESGQYIGEVVTRRLYTTTVSLKNLTPDWYRNTLAPFAHRAERRPAFWAWRPGKYPDEVAYVWLTDDPRPQNAMSNGFMSVDMNFEGLA